ncbi:MAG: M23 family metallopeptidase [Paracoccaceae bacterium]|nr:M23 family metallopeptidase [Paracoccaceae bacterium]
MKAVALLAVTALTVSGCVSQLRGYTAPYPSLPPFAVTVPPNAPSLSQQYVPARDHIGTDFVAETGRPVLAAAPGRIAASFFSPAYGHTIAISHGPDPSGRPITTRYVHLATRTATPGSRVARGQAIGTLGRSGVLSGGIPHLHFEVWIGPLRDQDSTVDANALWVDGPGRVTCFEPGRDVPSHPFRITHPVACD